MKGFCLIRATNCQVYLKINNVFSGLLNNQQVVVRNGIEFIRCFYVTFVILNWPKESVSGTSPCRAAGLLKFSV